MTSFFAEDQPRRMDRVRLPLMSLREVVMFPRSIVPLFVGREASIKAIENAVNAYDKKIFLVAQRAPETEKPQAADLFRVGTVSKILQMLRLPDGTIKVLFEGLYRAEWDPEDALSFEEEFPTARVIRQIEDEGGGSETEAMVRTAQEAMEHYGRVNKKLAPETILAINAQTSPGRLADAIMPHLKVDYIKKQEILELADPNKRLEEAYALLQGEIEISSIEKKIKSRVKQQMEKNQREYYLNEQLKAIHKEMGRDEDPLAEVAEFEQRLKDKDLPEDARDKALRELKKLKHTPPSSAEYTVVRNYLEW
ncbi:MAG TPA: LON peptidase substrate-binding domain-containing protein, partial [Holophaga sp.]|nr:LON peptidase substrate-binding domain-containing protein [Holophaga sp.]